MLLMACGGGIDFLIRSGTSPSSVPLRQPVPILRQLPAANIIVFNTPGIRAKRRFTVISFSPTEEGRVPTVEGKEARVWIDAYVNKAGKLSEVAKAVRALVKKTVAGSEEYVNPWKIP